ncbi:hypothetical protein [Sphingopyxis yananensis]|uniref:hypothetical protein n=1 Tax=Sphingopyxis yananensis TaxID=2886687 RepID=UPI001D100FD2|nr:hypothetical protein [Sphingopyxis yananensis]MCC2602540.1 hypothetical protein [Sphingopyxis yananensis]
MTDITTKIGKYNRDTRTVPVTFTSGAIVHKRDVNAVLTDAGRYDAEATAARVADVANGVAHKIACGAITAAPQQAD